LLLPGLPHPPSTRRMTRPRRLSTSFRYASPCRIPRQPGDTDHPPAPRHCPVFHRAQALSRLPSHHSRRRRAAASTVLAGTRRACHAQLARSQGWPQCPSVKSSPDPLTPLLTISSAVFLLAGVVVPVLAAPGDMAQAQAHTSQPGRAHDTGQGGADSCQCAAWSVWIGRQAGQPPGQ
jgi:hypothetical protein